MIEVRCPGCRARTVRRGTKTFPFCSERCRDLDLADWVEERHRIAGPPSSSAEAEGGEGLPVDGEEITD